MRTRQVFFAAGVALLVLGAVPRIGHADFACNTVIARKGDAAAGEGTFWRFAGLAVNDAGLVAFTADRVKKGGTGVFVKPPAGPLQALARKGGAAPGGSTFAGAFSGPSLAEDATIAFSASLSGLSGARTGVFKGTPGALAAVARQGDPAPGCGGQFRTFGAPSLDEDGDVAFSATLTGSPTSPSGVFVVHGDGAVTTVACAEVPTWVTSGFNVVLEEFGDAVQNDAGVVAYIAEVDIGGGPNPGYSDALYRYFEGTGDTELVTRLTDPAPEVPAETLYRFIDPPAIDAAGAVAYRAFTSGTTYQGIFVEPLYAAPFKVVTRGDPVPGSPGTRFKRFRSPAMNASGAVAAQADNLKSKQRHEAIFVPAGGVPEKIALDGEPAPVAEPGVIYRNFGPPALSDNERVVFTAKISGAPRTNYATVLCERL